MITPSAPVPTPVRSPWPLLTAALLAGLGGGLAGTLLALLLHAVQHLAYGYGWVAGAAHESFLQGASAAPPSRRLLAMAVCGLIAGMGWWALYRFGRPLVGVKKTVADPAQRMPVVSTLWHGVLQIITVGLGSPLGREVAPRELGALMGSRLGTALRLDADQQRLVIACGAGAGLAAVYNVPLGAACFVLEVLLVRFTMPAATAALGTAALGALVAWVGLGTMPPYVLPALAVTPGLVVWSVLAGPLIGVAAHGFARLMTAARRHAPKDARLIPLCLLNFAGIGLLALWLPELLGNGKSPAQLAFGGLLGPGLAAMLLVLRTLIVASTLRAGAEGGLLTPALASGALFAIILGAGWDMLWPGTAPGAFAVVGAAAFLSVSMKMPISAIVLTYEFTRFHHDLLVPVALAVVGAQLADRFLTARTG